MEQTDNKKISGDIVFSHLVFPKIHFERELSENKELFEMPPGQRISIQAEIPVTFSVVERNNKIWWLVTLDMSLKFVMPESLEDVNIICELTVQGRAELENISLAKAEQNYVKKVSKKRTEQAHQILYAVASSKAKELVNLIGMGNIPIPISL